MVAEMQDHPVEGVSLDREIIINAGKDLRPARGGLHRKSAQLGVGARPGNIEPAFPEHLKARTGAAVDLQQMCVSPFPGGNARLEGSHTAMPHPALTFTVKLQSMHASPHRSDGQRDTAEAERTLYYTIGRLWI